MNAFRTIMMGAIFLGFPLITFGQQAKDQPNFREMFLKLDKNADGIIEADEVPDAGKAAFDRLLKTGDSNKDGKLSAEEMRGLGQKMQVLADPAAVAARFKNMDKDKDGKVTREEWTGVAKNFETIDTDKDGKISEPELVAFSTGRMTAAPAPEPKKPETAKPEAEKPKTPAKKAGAGAGAGMQRFKQMDKDNDGKLSKEEFPRPKIFERLDTNNDGFLTPAELAKLKAE